MSQFAVKWIFELHEDFTINVKSHFRAGLPANFPGCAFEDGRGKRRLEIHPDGTLRVLASYAWDGCTPKFALWDIVLGIPDGVPNQRTRQPKAYYASLVHDVLYQFLPNQLPVNRAAADAIFLELLTRDGFGPRWVYYAAVRVFGGMFRPMTHWKRSYDGRSVPLAPAEPHRPGPSMES